MESIRRQFTPQQKVAILREHLIEDVPVSDLCDKQAAPDALLPVAESLL